MARPSAGGFRPSGLAIAGGVVLLAAVALVFIARSGTPAAGPRAATVAAGHLAEGQAPPDFTASTFDGKTITLSSLKGKAVLLNFFASWCVSCRAEMPAIEAAYRANRDRGFVVVGVNSLESGDGTAFYRELGMTFTAVYDPGIPGNIAKAYGVTRGLPVSIFINREGRVDLIQVGEMTRPFIEQELGRLL